MMIVEEILNQILHELKDVKQDLNGVKQDIKDLKQGQERLETRIASLDERQGRLESKMANFEDGQGRLETRMVKLEDGQGRLETKVDNLSLELRSNFKFTNDKLDEHKKVFDVVSDEIKSINVNIDYLSSKSGKHDMELNNIINKLRS